MSVPKKLSNELLNLDIDEGVRIESTKNRNKMKVYINKRTSRCFVLETCSGLTNKSKIRFYSDIKHIHKLIHEIFGREYFVTIY